MSNAEDLTCVFCNGSDEVEVVDLGPNLEALYRAYCHIPAEVASEDLNVGVCAKCIARKMEEQRAEASEDDAGEDLVELEFLPVCDKCLAAHAPHVHSRKL